MVIFSIALYNPMVKKMVYSTTTIKNFLVCFLGTLIFCHNHGWANADFSNISTPVHLKDLSKEDVAKEGPGIVTCVSKNSQTTFCNMSSFYATSYDDTFTLIEIIGRKFDGSSGIDAVSYENILSDSEMTIIEINNFNLNVHQDNQFDTLISVENIKLGSTKKNIIKLQNAAGRKIDGTLGKNDVVYYSDEVIFDQKDNQVISVSNNTKDELIGIEHVILKNKYN